MNSHRPARIEHEIIHGKKLAEGGAEAVWNWSSPAGQKRADRRAQYLASVGKLSSNVKALEIGCGTGLFTRKIWRLTAANITAIDISEELLNIARRNDSIGPGKYINGDAMHLGFADGEFEVVFGSSILHHLDFDKVLPEIFRVLKNGGRMTFAEPNMLNPQILIQKNVPAIKKRLGDSPDETAVVRWKLARQMRQIGFTNVRIFPYDFLHPMTPPLLIPLVSRLGEFLENIPVLREIAGSVMIYGEKSPAAPS